jgi:hypothetical protein
MLRAEVRKLRDWTTNNTNKVEGIRSLIYDIQGGTLMLPSKDFFPHLYQELSAYSYRISPNGTMTFNAPSGFFDDCVMSLMLANEARTKIAFSKSKLYVGGGVKLNMYETDTHCLSLPCLFLFIFCFLSLGPDVMSGLFL